MKLQKLTPDNITELGDKKICCYEYSPSYLEEVCRKYDISGQIQYIIDENTRNHGIHRLAGRDIEVCGTECLADIPMENTTILITGDYFMEAYEKLSAMNFLTEAVDTVYYFASRETEYEEAYRSRYKERPLADIILFRSGPHASSYVKGMDFADNARALFEYLLAKGYNKKYELVWLVKNPESGVFARYRDIKNVSFVSFDWSVSEEQAERDSYYRALCLAKYLFFTDAYGFARNCREDQIRVQLWHGCGFKTRVNFVRCEKRYEYTTVISDLYSKIHQEIYGLREDQVLVTGYAKQDWLFRPIDGWQERLGVPEAEKYIFWLPTFRSAKEQLQNLNEYELDGQTGLPVVHTYKALEELNSLLEEEGIVLVIKLHPFQDKGKIGMIDLNHIVMLDNEQLVEMDIPVNRLLGHADALISDYSSAAVDYMLLDRPMAFTLDDVEEYEQSRGFVFENIKEQLPGREVYSFADLCGFVREVGEGADSVRAKRRQLINVMHKYQDDQSCRRIVEILRI